MMHDTLTVEDLRFKPPALPATRLLEFVRERFGIDGTLTPLSGERDQNFRLTDTGGVDWVLKVASPIEDRQLIDFQVQALLCIEDADPDLPVPRLRPSVSGGVCEDYVDASGDIYPVRVLTWVDGVPIVRHAPPSPSAVRAIGVLQGRMCRALRGFSHPAEAHFMPWDTLNDLVISEKLCRGYMPEQLANRAAPVIERLQAESLPRLHRLPAQVIHNDAHAGNVLCDDDDPDRITGVIDFGDLVRRPIVVDLATSLASIVEHSDEPLCASAALVAGFRSVMAIPDEQSRLLYDAVAARALLTVQLLTFRVRHTEAAESLGSVELPRSIHGATKLLDIDAGDFLDAVSAADSRDSTQAGRR